MKIPIGIVLLLLAFSVSAQTDDREKFDMDVSLIGGFAPTKDRRSPDKRLGLQFRKRINPIFIFKASAVYNKSLIRHATTTDYPEFISDSLQIFRNYYPSSRKQFLFRSGIDFDISKYLLLGANLIIGYSQVSTSFYDRGYSSPDQGATWEWCRICTWEYQGQVAPGYSNISNQPPAYGEYIGESTYLIYGTSINLGFQLPILKRFAIGVQYQPQLLRFHHKQDLNAWPVGAFESFTSVKHFIDAFVRVAF